MGILVTFALIPAWLKFQAAPAPFTATYILGFVIIVPIIGTIAAWILTGLPGLSHLLQDKWRLAWLLCWLMLAAWGFFSQGWAFIRLKEPGVGQNAALHLWLLVLFLIATASAAPPLRMVMPVFIVSLLINSLIGGLQVATQASIGLGILGEFSLEVAKSGTSVIQVGDMRWLRPYGLLPHPNVYSGVLIVGLFAAAAWSIGQNRWQKIIGTGAFLAGLWLLFLTFSRGAWLGFGVGILAILPLVARYLQHYPKLQTAPKLKLTLSDKPLAISGQRSAYHALSAFKSQFSPLFLMSLFSLLMGILFLWLYHPLVLARAGTGLENTEMRSIADRIVYTDIAWDAIQKQPITGVGVGNFAWYASYYLYYNTDYDLKGDNVHNVGLMVWSELGIVGLSLFLLMLFFGILATFHNIQRSGYTPSRIALFGIVLALVVVGLFDHYPVTLIHGQIMWLGILALGVAPAEKSPDSI
jgi:O-antigen ligase